MIWRRIHKSTAEQEEKFKREIEEVGLEKGDRTALLLSAFFTIFLPVTVFLVLFALLILWIFGAL